VIAAALTAWLSASALAADAPALPEMAAARNTPGWTRLGRSLVLYDAEGALSQEVGLVGDDSGTTTRETTGGHSPDGRAAWTLERRLVWNATKSKVMESRRKLVVYGSQGQTLWTDDAVDRPEEGDPVVFSDDSTVVLVALHFGESWSVEARDWTGGVLARAGPFPRLRWIRLSPNGRFATMRWSVPDKSDTHTFLDARGRARKDIETAELALGLARLGDDGQVRTGRRVAYAFDLSATTATVKSEGR
jgi:hypothetical protein